MLLGKEGSEVMWVDVSIVPIPLFGVDVTRVDRLVTRSKILTLREVLTKRLNVLKGRQRLEQETRGLSHNLDKLWIRKTNTVIA